MTQEKHQMIIDNRIEEYKQGIHSFITAWILHEYSTIRDPHVASGKVTHWVKELCDYMETASEKITTQEEGTSDD